MGSIKHAAVNRILHLAGLDHRVYRQKVDFQILGRHRVYAIDVRLGILKENTTAPCGLHLDYFRFCARDAGRSKTGDSGNAGSGKKFAS